MGDEVVAGSGWGLVGEENGRAIGVPPFVGCGPRGGRFD